MTIDEDYTECIMDKKNTSMCSEKLLASQTLQILNVALQLSTYSNLALSTILMHSLFIIEW